MLRKKESFTVVTPIPGFIPRQLAIDILHSHSEIITLNPLVIDHRPIQAPRDASADEFYCTWYEIVQRIQYMPGIGKLGSGKLTFTGCFHDMPWGLQSHMYIPFNVDLRNKYRIAGNQPGIEAPEPMEIGLEQLGAPKDGLYLREDIEFSCNVAMTSFIRAQMKAARKEMVSRIIKKAELLDAGILQGMMLEGKLKTHNPNDRSEQSALDRQSTVASAGSTVYQSGPPPGSPGRPPSVSPSMYSVGKFEQQGMTPPPLNPHRYSTTSSATTPPPYNGWNGQQQQHQSYPGQWTAQHNSLSPPPKGAGIMELPSHQEVQELPGDFHHPEPSPGLAPPSAGQPTQQWANAPPRWSGSQVSPYGGSYSSQSGPTSPYTPAGQHPLAQEMPVQEKAGR